MSVYSGATWAPFGSVREDGWRLRFAGGYGLYNFDKVIARSSISALGDVGFADVLAGYQVGMGPLTLKLFAGATFEGHGLVPFDPDNNLHGRVVGAKIAGETWLNLSPDVFVSINGAWANIHESVTGRVRLGYRLHHQVAIGVEGAATRNSEGEWGRGGMFVTYQWGAGEVTFAGGVSARYSAGLRQAETPYARLVYLTRF